MLADHFNGRVWRLAIDGNLPPVLAGSSAGLRFRPIAWFQQLGADHVDMVSDCDEGRQVEAGDNGLSGLSIDEANRDDPFAADDVGADLDIAVRPDFQFCHDAPFPAEIKGGTIKGSQSGASGEAPDGE